MSTTWTQSTTDPAVLSQIQGLENKAATIPTPANDMPPAVADTGAKGTETQQFALANHTHASKVRKIRATTAVDGTYTWTYAVPFDDGVVPVIAAVAETPAGVTDVINLQVETAPTNTSCKVRVTRANRAVASLLGLTILSIPTQPGATVVHLVAVSP